MIHLPKAVNRDTIAQQGAHSRRQIPFSIFSSRPNQETGPARCRWHASVRGNSHQEQPRTRTDNHLVEEDLRVGHREVENVRQSPKSEDLRQPDESIRAPS